MSRASRRHLRCVVEKLAAPLYAVTVSGGKLSPGSRDRLLNLVEGLKAKPTFHSVLVLEAQAPAMTFTGGSTSSIGVTSGMRRKVPVRSVAGEGSRHRGLRGKQEAVVWTKVPTAGRAS